MTQHVEAVIRRSSADFQRLVWPRFSAEFGDAIPVETETTDKFAAELDRRAGIDVWLIGVDGHMRGLASRVQWQPFNWETFTVRVRSRFGRATEYDKRKAEMVAPGAVSAYYFIQGYVRCANTSHTWQHPTCTDSDHPELLGAAIAPMRDVIDAVDRDIGRLMRPNPDGSQMYVVPWSAIATDHIRIWAAPAEDVPGQLSLLDDWGA